MFKRGFWAVSWSPSRSCAWRSIRICMSSKRSGVPGPAFVLSILIRVCWLQHFCKETVLWKNISHPNILGLIAVEIDSYTGNCSMISELMANGNIFSFIQSNSVNRLRLVIGLWFSTPPRNCNSFSSHLPSPQLADAAEGLQYLHDRRLIHGDIKGVSLHCPYCASH